jgi:hypothetical protein
MLDLIVNLGTLVASAATAAGLVIGIAIYRRQMNAQLFIEYTRRYDEIMGRLSSVARQSRLDLSSRPPEPSDELTLVVLKYLNLSSEEFYLCKRGYLSRRIWTIWEKELERTIQSPLFRREWKALRSEFDSYAEFQQYVDATQASTIDAPDTRSKVESLAEVTDAQGNTRELGRAADQT